MRKVVYMKGQNQEVDRLLAEMDSLCNATLEKATFIKKQFKDMMDSAEKEKGEIWTRLRIHLHGINALTTQERTEVEGHKLNLEYADNAVFCETITDKHPLEKLLKGLLS